MLQRLVDERSESAKQLESLLQEKERTADIQIRELENSVNESKKTAEDLTLRLDAANSTISELRSQVLEQRTKLSFGSEESANSTFTLLNLKNKEIDSLKRVPLSLSRSTRSSSSPSSSNPKSSPASRTSLSRNLSTKPSNYRPFGSCSVSRTFWACLRAFWSTCVIDEHCR